MIVEKNKSLLQFNTFGFDHRAEFFCQPESPEQLQEALAYAQAKRLQVFVLGAGSNIVLTKDISGLVLQPALKSVSFFEHEGAPCVSAEAGVNWHALVRDTVARGLFGLQNLTLIPGNAGAAPIQNIGAYGSELKDCLTELHAVNIRTGESLSLSNADCRFAYRDSVFKHELAGELVIVSLTLKLSDSPGNSNYYPALAEELERCGCSEPDAQQISAAVARIRQQKLPDPAVLGNAGSFFKNPEIPVTQLDKLLRHWPQLPHYAVSPTHSKIPAAWLVERCGWKGRQRGGVGVHDRQALVLVNYGQGTASELLSLAESVRESVQQQFGILLEQEPQTI